MTTPMTPEALLAAGFKELNGFADCDRQWQYCSTDEHGTRFFVQVRLWDHPRAATYDAWASLSRNKQAFQVELHDTTDMPPAAVKAWFLNLWVQMECDYYERNDA